MSTPALLATRIGRWQGTNRLHDPHSGSPDDSASTLVIETVAQNLFVRVIPNDYRRVLEAQKRMLAKGLSREEAEMAAFEENAKSEVRAQGK